MRKPLGVVVYDGPSELDGSPVVAIATMKTKNVKTGNMIQVWILRSDENPFEALKNDDTQAICGTCPLQNNGCYVRVDQAANAIYKAYKRGAYENFDHAKHARYFADREVRLGAYGDPAALPTSTIRQLTQLGRSWTGYSHQLFWIDQRRANALARYVMASCHNRAQMAEAARRGWRYFGIVPEGKEGPKDALECPNSTRGISCSQCRLCCGTSKGAKSIWIHAHGRSASAVEALQDANA